MAASLHRDVVLLDLGMPGVSGVEAFPVVSELCSRIVIYSAFRDAEREVRGAAAYLQKGCSLEELTRTVTTLAGAA